MKHVLIILMFTVLLNFSGKAQCNGSFDICTKPYNEVAFLTTHNAFNAGNEGFSLPNQNDGLTAQLNNGVRALMLDVYDLWGTVSVYHGTSILGSASLQSNLAEIKSFLDNNPNEIVTIIFECYVSANDIETEFSNAGLINYLYTKNGNWNTLQEMINNNQRLVVFTDVDDASTNQPWYHYVWNHAVETHYSVNSINDFTNDYNRGDANNDLFIFNHFVTNSVTGTGMPDDAPAVNAYSFLMARIQGHFAQYQKFPNFITLDFYELGDGLAVVDSLNATNFSLGISLETTQKINLYPNPAKNTLTIKLDQVYKELFIFNPLGEIQLYQPIGMNENEIVIDVENWSKGTYLVQITSENGLRTSEFIID
jgi:hypothetical protein